MFVDLRQQHQEVKGESRLGHKFGTDPNELNVVDRNRAPWRRVGKGAARKAESKGTNKQGEQRWTKKGRNLGDVMDLRGGFGRIGDKSRDHALPVASSGEGRLRGSTVHHHCYCLQQKPERKVINKCQSGHLQDSSRTRIISPPTVWVWVWVVCQRIHTHIQLQW